MHQLERLLDVIGQEMRETARWTGRSTLSSQVVRALATVRREAFVAPGSEGSAYENRPLPIGHGQTISQPFIVGLMTELLDLKPGDTVLEVGTGSGYQAAVLAELVDKVYSIETIPELASAATAVLAAQGCANVVVRTGDGRLGWPEHAPFNAIIVTAAGRAVPQPLLDQLALGGRMVIPIGPHHGEQELLLITKGTDGTITQRHVLSVAFVPLT